MKVKIIYPPKDPKYRESFEIYNALGDDLFSEDADYLLYIMDLRIYLTGETPHLYPLKEAIKGDPGKIVIIDYSDPYSINFIPPEIIEKVGWYFKRSVVKRKEGMSLEMMKYPHLPLSGEITPIHFAVREDYLRYENSLPSITIEEKKYDIACMFLDLPENRGGPGGMRAKVVDVVKNRCENVFQGVVYDKDFSQRYGIVNKEYYETLRDSKIIVTANPKSWEGDFRLWEALLTGSMVMCDRMLCNPGLVDKTHIIWYDNPEHLDALLTYYLQKPDEIDEIGKNGKLWCLSNGLYKHRVRDVLETIKPIRSSYKSILTYGDLLEALVFSHHPKDIIEFGILDGYSLKYFAESGANVEAYDIFDEFVGNGPPPDIREKFKEYKNVTISYGDFYDKWREIEFGHFDMIHIDIANNGHVYRTAVEKYLPLLNEGGSLILEGGSEKRDKVEWMGKYQKPLIHPYLESLDKSKYRWKVIGDFPSLTIIQSI